MEHILRYFVGGGYNLVNTTVYTAIVFLGYYLFYKAIKKYVPFCRIDKHFIFGVLVFVFFGAFLRILEQDYTGAWLVKPSTSPIELGYYFHTPGWLLLLSLIFLVCFVCSVLLFREKYYCLLIPFGIFLCVPLFIYEIINIKHGFVLAISLLSIAITFIIIQFFAKLKLLEDQLVILSQIIDFSATLCGVFFFGDILYEQHPVSRTIIWINPFLFPIAKIVLAFLFIGLVEKYVKDKEERTYTKLLVIILGFLTGLRDILTISLLN